MVVVRVLVAIFVVVIVDETAESWIQRRQDRLRAASLSLSCNRSCNRDLLISEGYDGLLHNQTGEEICYTIRN